MHRQMEFDGYTGRQQVSLIRHLSLFQYEENTIKNESRASQRKNEGGEKKELISESWR
jgi:hypothetical protein